MVASGEMQEITGYVDSYNASSEPGQLHGTGHWYLLTSCSRHMTNEKINLLGNLSPRQQS